MESRDLKTLLLYRTSGSKPLPLLKPEDFPVVTEDGSDVGDDSIVGGHVASFPAKRLTVSKVQQPRPNVRYKMVGRDVLAYKRAIVLAGYRRYIPARDDGTFGSHFTGDVKKFQTAKRLYPDGVIGAATYSALYRYFDSYGLWLLRNTHHIPTSVTQLEKACQVALYAAQRGSLIHYLQQRPMSNMPCPPGLDTYADCSEFVTWCYRCAGLPDPNGLQYDGYGNTATMLNHGTRVSVAAPGSLVFYGTSSVEHVAIAVSSTQAISHGNEAGPYAINVNISGWWHTMEIRKYA